MLTKKDMPRIEQLLDSGAWLVWGHGSRPFIQEGKPGEGGATHNLRAPLAEELARRLHRPNPWRGEWHKAKRA